jgi:Transposase, Mutator family
VTPRLPVVVCRIKLYGIEIGAPGSEEALAEIWGAEDKTHALTAVTTFTELFGAKFPKAVAKITDDLEQLLAFYDYPAEHWVPAPRTRSSRRSRPSATARRSSAGPARQRPGWRWPTS